MNKRPSKTSHHIAICEANYLRLDDLLLNFSRDRYEFEVHLDDLNIQYISFLVLERTKHTLMIEAKQVNKNKSINDFNLRVNIFIDARLAEVASYQSERPLPFFYKKSFIQSKDEKNQQNRFLTEWLESIFISGIAPKSVIEKMLDE
tara:strand:+ start:799 stop:1239 length:441 start_codon:yes stop_codon:yes gene_type:complete